jgi:hypothetical protein
MRKIFFTMAAVLIIGILYFQFNKESFIKTNEALNKSEELHFGMWDADIQYQNNAVLNLVFIHKSEKNSSNNLKKDIKGIYFNNNSKLRIDEFRIDEGEDIREGYKLYTLIVYFNKNFKGLNKPLETLVINFNNEINEKYKIGSIRIKDYQENDSYISVAESYIVSYPKFDYWVELENTSSKQLIINDFSFNNDNLQLTDILIQGKNLNTGVIIKPGEKFLVEANVEELSHGSYDFYQSVSKIKYTIDNNLYETLLPPHLYEIENINDSKIEQIIKR